MKGVGWVPGQILSTTETQRSRSTVFSLGASSSSLHGMGFKTAPSPRSVHIARHYLRFGYFGPQEPEQSREYTIQCPLDTLPCVCVPISPLCWHDLHQPPYLTSPRPAAASLKMVAAAPALLLLGLSSLAAGQWDPSPLMEGRIIILPSTQPSRPSR